MGKVWAVIRREYLERVRSKWFLFATFFGPVLMGTMIFVPAFLASKTQASAEGSNIVILDASERDLGERIAQSLSAFGPKPAVEKIHAAELARAESTAAGQVMRKERTGYLVVDQQTASGERARYSGRNASSLADMKRIENTTEQAILTMRFEGAGLDPSRVRELSRMNLKFEAERLTERGRGGGGRASTALAYVVALLLYMSIVLYGQAIMLGVIEEKTQRVAEVVVASISPGKLLAGKVIGVGSVGLTQMLTWVLSAFLLLRFQVPIGKAFGISTGGAFQLPSVTLPMGLGLLCFFLLGYTLFSSLFAAAGSMVSSTQDAQQVATPLTFLIVPSMLLLTPMLMQPSSTLSRVVSIIPVTAPILMPVRMSLVSVPWTDVLVSIALLAATCMGAIWLASRIYRVGVLMYGKKPSMREVARWVREAH